MLVSVFTDASVSPEQKVGGFAFYIGAEGWNYKRSGIFRQKVRGSYIAEIYCIANALHYLKAKKHTKIDRVWIFSDCSSAIDAIYDKGGSKSDAEAKRSVWVIRYLMMDIAVQNGLSFKDWDKFFVLQHVKAHTSSAHIYAKINKWCDVQARGQMKQALNQLKQQGNGHIKLQQGIGASGIVSGSNQKSERESFQVG